MTEAERALNCAKCELRKSQAKYMNRYFDYKDCPFVCTRNELYDKFEKIVRVGEKILYRWMGL